MYIKLCITFSFLFFSVLSFSTELIDNDKYESDLYYKKFVDLFKVPKTIQDPAPYYSNAKMLIDNFHGLVVNGVRYCAFQDRLLCDLEDTKYGRLFTLIGENKSVYSIYILADKTGNTFSNYVNNEASYANNIITPEWHAIHSEILSIGNIWSVNIKKRKTIVVFHKCFYILFISFKEDANKIDILKGIISYFDDSKETLDKSIVKEDIFVSIKNSKETSSLSEKWAKECSETQSKDSLRCKKAISYNDEIEENIILNLSKRICKNPSQELKDNSMREIITANSIKKTNLIIYEPSTPRHLENINGFVSNYMYTETNPKSHVKNWLFRIGVIYCLSEKEAIDSLSALRVLYSSFQNDSLSSQDKRIEKMQDQARRFAKSSISLGDRCFQGTDPRTSDLSPLKKRGYELFFLVGNTAVMVISFNENADDIVLEIATQIEQVLTGKKKSFTPLKTVSGPADSSK